MTDQITAETVEWARTHDWGLNATLAASRYGYFVPAITGLRDVSAHVETGAVTDRTISFTSRRALREWAGY